jgi:hypothetical protein
MCCLGTGYILDFCTPKSVIKEGFAWWRHMPIYPEVCFRCQSKVVVLILLQCNQNRLQRILWDPHLGRKLIKSFRPMAFPSRITCIEPVGMVHCYYPASTYCDSLKIWVTRAEKLRKLLYLTIIWSREELGIVDKFLGAPWWRTPRQSDSYNLPLDVPSAFRHKRGISHPLIWSIEESKKIGKW